MNKTWISLIVIAIITLLGIVGYQFYLSLSGQNVEFNESVVGNPIAPNLGTNELEYLQSTQDKVIVDNSELEQ